MFIYRETAHDARLCYQQDGFELSQIQGGGNWWRTLLSSLHIYCDILASVRFEQCVYHRLYTYYYNLYTMLQQFRKMINGKGI